MPEIIITGTAGRIEGRTTRARQRNAAIASRDFTRTRNSRTMNHQIIYQLYYALWTGTFRCAV